MKKLITTLLFVSLLGMPTLAQWQQWRLSSEDQQRFDSYFSRWQEYRQRDDRGEIISMEKRMQDVYEHYNIPADTPFWRVASNGRSGRDQWRGRLSARDQERFDSYFSRWQDYKRTNNREQIVSMEKRMQDVYSHYRIPHGTPYFMIATNAGDDDWDRWERGRWRAQMSNEDQGRFDSYYTRWLEYRRDNRRSDMESMERRMRDLMDHYQIPPRVRYEEIASLDRSY
jgi:hypothetical protein